MQLNAQRWSEKMAETVMTIWKDSLQTEAGKPVTWANAQGVVLKGIEGLWLRTGDKKYFDYIQKSVDYFVEPNGEIRTYSLKNYDIENVLGGRNLLTLYDVLGNEKYYKAASSLREQLNTHPRTKAGVFWYKQDYPGQIWPDALYMGQPFYTKWAKQFHEDTAFEDIAGQFILMERTLRDKKTGLLFYGYDELREQQWANKETGLSPDLLATAMGWYGMALIDVLENFPEEHPRRDSLTKILKRFANAVVKYQDKKTGLWYNMIDSPKKEKNYLEASASCMIVYALAKSVRLGFIPKSFLAAVQKGYAGVIAKCIKTEIGQVNFYSTAGADAVGNSRIDNESLDYLSKEKMVVNAPVGVGAFLLASNEVEQIATQKFGKYKTVTLDNYFNSETRKDVTGTSIPYHYVWDEMDNNGFSLLGNIFKQNGAKINTLSEAPVYENLSGSSVYIIVDPDTEKENLKPNYILPQHVKAVYNWVKEGGVLVLLANDSSNTEFTHLNKLAERFGIHFNGDSRNKVQGNRFEEGAIEIPAKHSIFKTAKKVYIKELSSLKVTAPARVVLRKDNFNVVATAKVGHGYVIAVGDPWFYNEYTDGRKLPATFENYKAAQDFVKWVLTIKTDKGDIIPF
ncbi:MAG TPA: glycoside hydrolase family 88 protein [Segetibacter sp.]